MNSFDCSILGIYVHSSQKVPDYRSNRGKVYPLDLLLFCLLITELGAIHQQRAKHRYLRGMWSFIREQWYRLTKQSVPETTPSQSTLCRLMGTVDSFALMRLFHRMQLETMPFQNTPLDGLEWPQYAIDGKARKGIKSEETGRTEMDVTVFSVETRTVIAKMALNDKKGESRIASFLISDIAKKIAPGIFTCDSGITCPKCLGRIIKGGHQYIAALKSNAGNCYQEVKNFEWDEIEESVSTHDKGHGRIEVRKIKKTPIENFSDSFSKYSEVGAVLSLDSYRTIKGKTSYERRFYIVSDKIKDLPLAQLLAHIRNHWLQENGLHWVKDAVLKEDDSKEKKKKSSRLLGFLKDIAVVIGYKAYKSVKEFTDTFIGNPQKTFELLLE